MVAAKIPDEIFWIDPVHWLTIGSPQASERPSY